MIMYYYYVAIRLLTRWLRKNLKVAVANICYPVSSYENMYKQESIISSHTYSKREFHVEPYQFS